MTVRMKLTLLLGALVSLNLAVYGARHLLGVMYEPIIRSLGG